MALRDHTLDEKIITSARKEFMEHGFMKASLHTIARNAGITTGALYTRYKNKDELFRSLCGDVFSGLEHEAEPIWKLYMEARDRRDPDLLLKAVREEEKIYRKLLFEHYEACVLYFVKSEGSSVWEGLQVMKEKKGETTRDFFRSIANTDLDLDGVSLIISSQFRFYAEILSKGWSAEKACSALEAFDLYQEAGWKAVFRAML